MNADILALDIATTTGWARGAVGSPPRDAGSIMFGRPGASNNAVFGHALTWIADYLEPAGIASGRPRPTMLVLEAMLPPGAKAGATNRDTRDRLAGLHGIMRAVAHLRGIYEINEVSVGDVRAHFIGDRTLKRDRAKREVLLRCHQLGWPAEDDNAGDALALWSFACSLIDPQLAVRPVPMLNPKLRRVAP
jgi:hypothetical protein